MEYDLGAFGGVADAGIEEVIILRVSADATGRTDTGECV
jgi:hypothetical protein